MTCKLYIAMKVGPSKYHVMGVTDLRIMGRKALSFGCESVSGPPGFFRMNALEYLLPVLGAHLPAAVLDHKFDAVTCSHGCCAVQCRLTLLVPHV
jgi:hypothetical protein